MFKPSKKSIVVGGAALLLIGTGTAYAYWTVTGSGSSSAQTTTAGTLTVVAGAPVTGLEPGGSAKLVSGTFTYSSTTKVYVKSVVVQVDPTFSTQENPDLPACTAADFETSNAPVFTRVGTGDTWGGASIRLLDLQSNQDNCQDVAVPLVFSTT
ncbi:MAG: hypothetical protein GXX79_01450 [Actinomycetales bacterium]|nr:hypothetical protein [Actinomycetales bacterium]